MSTINLGYNVGDKVMISGSGREGKIDSIFIDSGNPQYRVDYFLETGEAKSSYFHAVDLVSADL